MDPKDEDFDLSDSNAVANTDDELQIEVVDDTPEKDRGRKPLDEPVEDPSDEELASYSENVQKKIKKLTHRSHDERRAKEAVLREKQELERVAQQLLEENRRLQGYVQTGSQQYIDQAKTLVNNDIEKAKRALKEATEAFDTDGIIAAQDALMEAKLRAREVQNFKVPTVQTPEKVVQTRQVQVEDDPIDEKTLRWQAKNQWYGAEGFEDVTSFALGLHQKLVNKGVEAGSDEYFDSLNSTIKSKFPEIFGDEDKPRSGGTSKKPTSVVAPATRSTGAKKVVLTKTQVALANKLGIPLQQYAAQVAKLEAQNG